MAEDGAHRHKPSLSGPSPSPRGPRPPLTLKHDTGKYRRGRYAKEANTATFARSPAVKLAEVHVLEFYERRERTSVLWQVARNIYGRLFLVSVDDVLSAVCTGNLKNTKISDYIKLV